MDSDGSPVTDAAWRLEDNLKPVWENLDFTVGFGNYWSTTGNAPFDLPKPQYRAHVRLYPTLPARPDSATASLTETQLWSDRFESRRYCWTVFYRFSQMPGPPTTGDKNLADAALRRPRRLSAYYVTLKRPVNARYAQQVGYNPNNASGPVADPWNPQALAPSEDLLLPVPWRIGAELIIPDPGNAAAGVASEITVTPGGIRSDILAEGAALIDDRTGQVFRVVQRRDGTDVTTLTLDKAYNYIDVLNQPEYEPMAADFQEYRQNWERYWAWQPDPTDCAASYPGNPPFECEQEPQHRFYWVFPPPVDAVRGAGNRPLFNGSPPVVDVTIRELVINAD